MPTEIAAVCSRVSLTVTEISRVSFAVMSALISQCSPWIRHQSATLARFSATRPGMAELGRARTLY